MLLALIAAGTLFYRLGSLPFIGADEPRYARISQEMSAGNEWVTPLLEGHPWLEKPPLYYWITIPIYRIFGPSETTARLGPALAALWTALVLYWVGAVLWSRLAGLLAGAVLLSSVGFAAFGRSASTDMPMAASLTTAFAILAVAAAKESSPGWRVYPAYVFFGLAVLAKGPVAILLAAGVCVSFWALSDGWSLRRWHVAPGIAVFLAVSLPWFWLAFRENGFGFILVFFINHNIARYISDIHHHTQPVYYYIPVLLGLAFPWSAWLFVSVWGNPLREFRRWRAWKAANLFLVCWIVFPVLFFSVSESKLPGYVLPVVPPLALLLGVRLADWIEGGSRPPRGAAWLHLSVSLMLGAAFVVILRQNYGASIMPGATVAAAMLTPAAVAFAFGLREKWSPAAVATTLQGVCLVGAIAVVVFPSLGLYHSTREIAHEAITRRQPGEPIVTYRFFHHTLNYYTGYQVEGDVLDAESLGRLVGGRGPILAVTEASRQQELQQLSCCKLESLATQGKLRLFRIHLRMRQNE